MPLFNDPKPPDVCPVCMENVPPRALACPECGADYNSGWREDEDDDVYVYDGLDLPDRNADGSFAYGADSYADVRRREFGPGWNWWPPSMKWVWWIAAVILLLGMILLSGGLGVLWNILH